MCDSWRASILWIQKPAVLFCLFFFLPGVTVQLLSVGNVHGFSRGQLLSLMCSQPSTSNISSCCENAACNLSHDCQQGGFINQPVGGAGRRQGQTGNQENSRCLSRRLKSNPKSTPEINLRFVLMHCLKPIYHCVISRLRFHIKFLRSFAALPKVPSFLK